MKVSFSGNLKEYLKEIIEKLPQVIDDALKDAAEQGAVVAKSHIAKKNQNGLWGHTVIYRDSATAHGIIADKFYAAYVEYGRGPVYPVRASALRFVIDGKVIFAKSVKAAAPKPFMKYALQFEQDNLNTIISEHIQKLVG